MNKFLKTDLGFVISAFLIWRIALIIVGLSAFYLLGYTITISDALNNGIFWDIWVRFDGGHYVNLALNGYTNQPVLTAFFPLFPLLIGIFNKIPFVHPTAAGLLISSIALIFAGFWLVKLVKMDFDEKTARKSFILLLLFPSAVFLGSVYTESLFLMMTIGALYFARLKKWHWVILFGFAAGLTRNLGCFLVLPLLYEYFRQFKFKIKWPILAAGAPGFGLISYMAYLWATFGDPLKFVHSQENWGREIVVNIFWRYYEEFMGFLKFDDPMRAIEIGLVTFVIVMIIFMIKKSLRPSYVIWSAVLILIPMMQNFWESINRFTLVIFPAVIMLAVLSHKKKYLFWIFASIFIVLLIYHTSLFVGFEWAG